MTFPVAVTTTVPTKLLPPVCRYWYEPAWAVSVPPTVSPGASVAGPTSSCGEVIAWVTASPLTNASVSPHSTVATAGCGPLGPRVTETASASAKPAVPTTTAAAPIATGLSRPRTIGV